MYTFNSRVRYSEVTKNQTMDLYSILNYFQDCSNFQSADLNAGVQQLTQRGRAWLLCAWQVELVNPPHLFDPIRTDTWPYDFKGIYGYRNFVLYNESRSHETAAYANSIWFLIDSQTGKPLRITEEDAAPYILEPAYPMEYAPRKITLPKEMQEKQGVNMDRLFSDAGMQTMKSAADSAQSVCPPIPVTKIFLDTNDHVNNSQYVRIAQSCLPESFSVRRMRAEYRCAARLGDVICPVCFFADPAHCYVSLNDIHGSAYAIVEFTAEK